jgi:SPP1 family holin
MKGLWVRTIVLVFALINNALVLAGFSPLPFENEEVEAFLSTLFMIGAALWSWWKNNSVSKEARQADEYLKELKAKKDQK